MGWGKVLTTYNCYYEFKDLADVAITEVRLYDGQGTFAAQPWQLYAKASATDPQVLLATFTGEDYRQWVEVTLPEPVPARYLVLRTSGGFPTEMELYGSYRAAAPAVLFPKKEIKLAHTLGINSFVWEFVEDPEREKVSEPKLALMQAFTQYRDYLDWERIETAPGQYAFNPTVSGGWNYDLLYRRLQQEGKLILPCLKTLPPWFLEQNYPAAQRDAENVPAAYTANLLAPASYLLQARLAFQFAARYGHNTAVNPALLDGVLTGPVYPTAPEAGTRTRERGLGYISYIECDNERDKWWKGRKAYQTAREYAANLSAFYDGHKNTLGPGVGVKNADPTFQVVIGGTASAQTDYIRGIIDWCKEYRGYKADGTVDLCFDVINYHYYATDAQLSQGGTPTRGAAPELSGAAAVADAFVTIGREYNVDVWLTEAGYDVNPGSPLRAPVIGRKTPVQVQVDWILRTALLYARHGISRLFFYQTYNLNPASSTQFASSGLLDGVTHRRKPAADYLYQAQKLLGDFTYQETISTEPLVDRYERNGQSMYALVLPSETGRTASYILPTGRHGLAKVYTPRMGQDSMAVQVVSSSTGQLNLTVGETPIFVVPATGAVLAGSK
ncbi:hypothetical protein [Hymenobacter defluvii]|uniref:Glycoside hydrolase family 42 N-terminal domain-containing protein n=1 Tax=Hymenobacter defluvii TaxID=2054411 RepID=A0ABS3THX0_9BACT|nr:hypothetical protein [Hymenobacter defluvii]MBO3273259.1 hypothetical protein [Hymenobacter defluvii]